MATNEIIARLNGRTLTNREGSFRIKEVYYNENVDTFLIGGYNFPKTMEMLTTEQTERLLADGWVRKAEAGKYQIVTIDD